MPVPHRKKPLTFLTLHSYVFAGPRISNRTLYAVSLGICPCIMEISEPKEDQKTEFYIGKARRWFSISKVGGVKLIMNSLLGSIQVKFNNEIYLFDLCDRL